MYNVCLIGLGKQGLEADLKGSGNEKKIISFAKAFNNNKNFKVTGIVDKSQEQIDKYTDHYKHDDLYGYDEIDIALYGQNYDVLCISTPDETHVNILEQIIKHSGLKPKLVICEKPLAMSCEEAKRIIYLYKLFNIPILVNYTRRFIPELIDLKNKYDNGDFGKLKELSVKYNGEEYHTCSHMIDFLILFFENHPEKLLLKRSLKDNYIKQNNGISKHDYRIWEIRFYFEKYFWEEQMTFNSKIPSYYDFSTKYLVENALQFLNGEDELKCTATEALQSLEIIEDFENCK